MLSTCWTHPVIATSAANSVRALFAGFLTNSGAPRASGAWSTSVLPLSRPAQRSLHVTVCLLTNSLNDLLQQRPSSLRAGAIVAAWEFHPFRQRPFASLTEEFGPAYPQVTYLYAVFLRHLPSGFRCSSPALVGRRRQTSISTPNQAQTDQISLQCSPEKNRRIPELSLSTRQSQCFSPV